MLLPILLLSLTVGFPAATALVPACSKFPGTMSLMHGASRCSRTVFMMRKLKLIRGGHASRWGLDTWQHVRAASRPRPARLLCQGDTVQGGSALASQVREALEHNNWPFLLEQQEAAGIQLSDTVIFSDGLQTLSGKEAYLDAAAAFKTQLMDEVPDAAVSVVRVAQVNRRHGFLRHSEAVFSQLVCAPRRRICLCQACSAHLSADSGWTVTLLTLCLLHC